MTTFKDCLRKAIDGQNVPEVTHTKMLDDMTDFLMLFCGLMERMPAHLQAKLVAEHSPSDDLVLFFQEYSTRHEMPRVFVWMAVAQLMGHVVEEWRAEEKLLAGPVQ